MNGRLRIVLDEFREEAAIFGRDEALKSYRVHLEIQRANGRPSGLRGPHGLVMLKQGIVGIGGEEIFRGAVPEAWRVYSRTLRLLRAADRVIGRMTRDAGLDALRDEPEVYAEDPPMSDYDYCPTREAS